MSTRRYVLLGVGLLVVAAALAAYALRPDLFGVTRQGKTHEPTLAELMQPGPRGDMALGDAHAPVTVIEYASMTCTHCAAFAAQTFPQLQARYIDTGKVRYILREFPLDALAEGAAALARCAPQDRFFDVVALLFHQQPEWAFVRDPLPALLNIAKQAGFTKETFDACLSNQAVLDGIEAVRSRAETFGVNATPSFFINGKLHAGEMSIDEIAKFIDPYLKG